MTSIRKATIEDCSLLNKLAWEIFPQTYSKMHTREQNEYMMEWMYSIESLTRQIADEGHVYFLLYEDEEPIGYVSVRPEGTDLFHLQKIYVLPSRQGKGYGKLLFHYAVQYIKEAHPLPCIMELNVNRHNNAVNFYQSMGMVIDHEGDFHIGNGYYMNDYIMRMEIV